MARRPPALRPQLSPVGMDGHSTTWLEVPVTRIFPVGGFVHVGAGDRRFYAQRLRFDRRRKDAQFLPNAWRDWRHCDRDSGGGVAVHPELLVPVFVPLRRITRFDFLPEPTANPAQWRRVH